MASLPFRFKSGESDGKIPESISSAGHSHRSTTKTTHKSFKSRKATKGSLRNASKGRIGSQEKGVRKLPYLSVISKFDRRNQTKQRQLAKHRKNQKDNSVFAGKEGAPRNVAVIPLCADGDVTAAIQGLNGSLDIVHETPTKSCFRVSIEKFKQKLQFIRAKRDLTACLDAARVADFVVMVLSAVVEVDNLGELILRSVESQGLSTLFTVVQGLDKIELQKQRQSVLSSLKSYMTHFHPGQEKLYSLDNRQECSNLMRLLCNATPKGIRWRDERSWMLVEDVNFPSPGSGSVVLTGVVRGKGLKADRLVQLGDWGSFQIEKITHASLAKKGKEGTNIDERTEQILEEPGEERDDLFDLAPQEVTMKDVYAHKNVYVNKDNAPATMTTSTKKGVLLDEHHYFSKDEDEEARKPQRVPKGTSSYQAAWYLDDTLSDDGTDADEYEMKDVTAEEPTRPEDGEDGSDRMDTQTEAQPSFYATSEMCAEPDEYQDALQLEEYRAKRRQRDEAEDDLEFPDEIELHPNALARERLAKYRGLKSLRTSPWLDHEDRTHEPEEWRRLLQVSDYQSSRAKARREALVGGVTPGTRVHVYLKDVPAEVQKRYDPSQPINLFSLLRHEHKKTVVNVSINLSWDHPSPIKSKEDLIMQCGPRRFVIKPLFSQQGTTPNDVHKYCRYLHPGQSAVASFTGPVTWGAVPVLFFQVTASDGDGDQPLPLSLTATGTAMAASTSRVIAKRVILTGHPYHIHKKIVTVRYMFFNRKDVEWFKALPLWTKRGRSGHIRDSLGTHGYFKAAFDGRINAQDAVGVSLYKRVWPRNAVAMQGSLLEVGSAAVHQRKEEAMMGDF